MIFEYFYHIQNYIVLLTPKALSNRPIKSVQCDMYVYLIHSDQQLYI